MPTQLTVDPKLLRPNTWNSNLVSPENEAKLVESIKQLGMFKPVVVRELPDKKTGTTYEILGGEHRWQGAVLLGMEEIPIFNLGEIDEITAKKVTLADNSRYGADDTAQLAEILEAINADGAIDQILPLTSSDISAIFSSASIALDELDELGLDENFETKSKDDEPAPTKAPKTHTIMRFKVANADAEKLTKKIVSTQKAEGFTAADELTNAGDALMHLLFGKTDE